MAAPACQQTARVSVPLSAGENQQRRKKKNLCNPTGGLILSIHKHTRSYEFIENSMQSRKSPACGVSTHVDEG